MYSICSCVQNNDSLIKSNRCKYDVGIESYKDIQYVEYNKSTGMLGWINDSSFLCSNIPIFDASETDKINEYINNGDISGSFNSNDVVNNQRPVYSDDIELPQNFHVISGHKYLFKSNNSILGLNKFSKDIVFNWQQTVDTSDYKYDVDVNIVYVDYDKSYNTEDHYKTLTSGWKEFSSNNEYKGNKNITLTLSQDKLNAILKDDAIAKGVNQSPGVNVAGNIAYITKIYVRVRNKVDNNCSNFVQSEIDFENKTVTNNETDEDGYTVDNAEYDNDDGTVDNEDDSGNSSNTSYNGNFGSLSSIMQYIRDGFGLIGNGGILTLMSATFLYLPDSIWIILKFFVSMMVAIALVKLVKDVIL